MIDLRRLAIVVTLLAVTACTKVQTGQHLAAADYLGSPRRVFILNRLDNSFDQTLPSNFQAAIVPALAACDVTALVYRPNSMELDAEAKLRNTLVTFRPDSVLTIVQTNRNLFNGEVRSGSYILTLRDIAQKRDVWKAQMGVSAPTRLYADRSIVGSKFATEVVTQLQADNVLKTCPPPPPKPGT